jgi:hypothetical protein
VSLSSFLAFCILYEDSNLLYQIPIEQSLVH